MSSDREGGSVSLERSTASRRELSPTSLLRLGSPEGGRKRRPGRPRHSWRRRYQTVVQRIDVAVVVASVGLTHLVAQRAAYEPLHAAAAVVVALGWIVALRLVRSTAPSILGHGVQKYARVVRATFATFGVVGATAALLRTELAWPYLAFSLPVAGLLLLASRKGLRSWLVTRRAARGEFVTDVLTIGSVRSAARLDGHFERHPEAGMRVMGVWLADEESPAQSELGVSGGTVPVFGAGATLAEVVAETGASTVVVTYGEHLGDHGVRELAWELHGLGASLPVSPYVTDVAAPRLDLQLVGSMPLLHVETPSFEGATRVNKRAFDVVLSGLALLVLLPVMGAIAAAVKLTSRGPVIYRSERVGAGAVPFEMLKFRTMVIDADALLADLTSDSDGLMFKMRHDPRVTPLGGVLRRFSLDELPQLVNVLRGEMSIVGPRPPLPAEVDQYDANVGRRLLVKQGLTGLWQVSGRSDLSWEDSVRLDLDYVENWSMRRDLAIIWQTFRAVLRRHGAY
jgi:exopolysaccharide biosynthesis polyprenyl glycosylphosphotransferase